MRNLFISILTTLILLSNLSWQPRKVDISYIDKLECRIESLENDLSEAHTLLLRQDSILNDPYYFAEKFVAQREKFLKFIKEYKILPGTNFYVKPGISFKKLDIELYSNLIAYNGPPGLITSNTRYWTKRSKHYTGRAIDIRWNWNIISYLATKEGLSWISSSNLRVLFENPYTYRDKRLIPKNINKWLKVNPRATAPHIHLERRS